MSVQHIIDDAIAREGGSRYTNHPSDAGGPTRWGVTERVARSYGYQGDMRELPRDIAVAIYFKDYVNGPGFHKVVPLSSAIAEELIDTGINCGPARPAPWLQRILNALNQQARIFPDLVVDGDIGPSTLQALAAVLKHRGKNGETVILRLLNSLQGAYYLELAERRVKNEDFLHGWVLNRMAMA